MKKFWFHFSLVAVVAFTPAIALSFVGLAQPHVYSNTFYGGLVTKDDRLEKVEGKKIVFLGGSSLSFGLRSEMMSASTGYEVVDYGLYAPLGIKTMAELAKSKMRDGDIVIFAPEISEETYSTNMDYEMFYKCSEDKSKMLFRFSWNDRATIMYNYPAFIFDRMNPNVELKQPYTKDSFNEYGDIQCDVVNQNILPELYDSGQMVKPSKEMINKEFINYVNDYASNMKRRGVKTFFTFSPTNRLALVEDNLEEFEKTLREKLTIDVLGSVKDFTYDEHYFYDTNYHLNYSGTVVH